MNNTTQTTLTSSSSNNDDDTPTSTTQSNNSNRLAPYNPTHATAQSTALNLLSLTSSDIFFDLGCGDGRLIISAIENCYDDDYLLKVHQERFSKLELYTHEDNSPTGSSSPQQLQPPVRRDVHATNKHNEATKTPPRRTAATQSQLNTPSSISSRKSIQHTRSHSDYSVPHLMRTSSQDDDSECLSGFDTPSTAYRREIISPSSPQNHLSPAMKKTTTQDVVTSVDENGSVKEDDVLSTISPLDQQLHLLQYTSSSSSRKGGGARIPDSPVTPIANNRRLNKVIITTLPVRNHSPPLMPNNDNKPELLNGESTTDISDSTIPKTIETPVCSPDGEPKHVIQISELPTDLSHVVGDDDVYNVQQEETGEGEESTTAKIDHPLLISGYPLSSIPSNDQIDIATSPMKEKNSSKKNDTAMGGKAAAVQGNTTNLSSGATTGSGSCLGDGLQCVGIEYNQALAESAQINVSKSYIYPHVEKKVCIRWGDVLDEWTRGEQQPQQKQVSEEDYKKDGVGNSNGDDNKNYDAWDDHDGEGNSKNDASKLTLLNDATAVFVYLLPQGLKKVKPLLYEAAVRRKRQRDQFMQCKQQIQQQIQEKQPQHPLHTHTLQQPLIQKERSSGTMTEDSNEFIPFPPKHLIQHRKGSSHVSDITDYDFRTSNNSKSSEELNKDMARGIILDEVDVLQQSNNMTHVTSIIPPPAFRVVSYMFAVPGWKPTKVDRTSKGSCPLYLYENIHEFLELKDEVDRGDS